MRPEGRSNAGRTRRPTAGLAPHGRLPTPRTDRRVPRTKACTASATAIPCAEAHCCQVHGVGGLGALRLTVLAQGHLHAAQVTRPEYWRRGCRRAAPIIVSVCACGAQNRGTSAWLTFERVIELISCASSLQGGEEGLRLPTELSGTRRLVLTGRQGDRATGQKKPEPEAQWNMEASGSIA